MEAGNLEVAWNERVEGVAANWSQTPPDSQSGSQPGSPQKESSNGSPSKGSLQGAGAVAQAACTEQKGRFPTTVTLRQDSDKSNVYIIMSFRGLEISSGFFGYGRKLENGEILNLSEVFQSSQVHLKVRVDNEETNSNTVFEYLKSTPKKIVPAKSKLELEGNGKIKLTLKKAKGDLSDWMVYQDHFSHPNGS